MMMMLMLMVDMVWYVNALRLRHQNHTNIDIIRRPSFPFVPNFTAPRQGSHMPQNDHRCPSWVWRSCHWPCVALHVFFLLYKATWASWHGSMHLGKVLLVWHLDAEVGCRHDIGMTSWKQHLDGGKQIFSTQAWLRHEFRALLYAWPWCWIYHRFIVFPNIWESYPTTNNRGTSRECLTSGDAALFTHQNGQVTVVLSIANHVEYCGFGGSPSGTCGDFWRLM